MDEEKFISLVSNYPELYDLENENYMNQVIKNNIWNEISALLGVTDTICKEKWKALRDAYHRSLKRRKSKSGDGAKKLKKWRYESQMEFFRPHFQQRISKTNIESTIMSNDDDDLQIATSPSSASVHSSRPNSRTTSLPDLETPGPSTRGTFTPDPETPRPPLKNAIFKNMTARKKNQPQSQVANVLQKYLDSRPTSSSVESTSPIHSFFNAMADTVAALSPHLQLKVKNQVYSIVSEAESENLRQTPATPESPASTALEQQTQFIQAGYDNLRSTVASDQPTTDEVTEYILRPSQSIQQPESQLRYRYYIGSDGEIAYYEN